MFNKLKISLFFLIILFVIKNSYSDFIIRVQSPGPIGEVAEKFTTSRKVNPQGESVEQIFEIKNDLKPNTDYYYNYLDIPVDMTVHGTDRLGKVRIFGTNVPYEAGGLKPKDNYRYILMPNEAIPPMCPKNWNGKKWYYLCLKEESLKGLNELLEAVKNQRNSDVQKLLEEGANPSIANKSGFNALTLAITSGYPETVTAIFFALKKLNKKELITELVNTPDKQGETPLQLAQRLARDYSPKEAYQKIIKILQDYGAK